MHRHRHGHHDDRGAGVTTRLALATLLATAAVAASPRVAGAIFASSLSAACYITAPNQCRIHVEPLTIDIASGTKIAELHVRLDGNVIYNFAPDFSNGPPAFGDKFTPSPVTLDFGALCGKTYNIVLTGRDTGDTSIFSLGSTALTCPDKNALKPPNAPAAKAPRARERDQE